MEDEAGAEEADALDDVGGDAALVGVAVTGEDAGEDGEEGAAEAKEHVDAEAGGLMAPLPLETDEAAEEAGHEEALDRAGREVPSGRAGRSGSGRERSCGALSRGQGIRIEAMVAPWFWLPHLRSEMWGTRFRGMVFWSVLGFVVVLWAGAVCRLRTCRRGRRTGRWCRGLRVR